MSGARPLHLSRRGAVYVVRFTLPRDMPPDLSGMEIRKSLQTKNIDEARAKCLDAEIWFQSLLNRLRTMNNPSRKDVELAANSYFDRLKRLVDVPRDFPLDDFDNEISFNIEESSRRIAEINTQLLLNNFDDVVKNHAQELVAELQTELSQLGDELGMIAMQLAAKAEREQNRYFIHKITEPHKAFSADDDIFEGIPFKVYQPIHSSRYPAPAQSNYDAPTRNDLSLSQLVQLHIAELKDRGNGETNISEFSRISTWLLGEIDGATPISSIETASLRDFRDKLKKRNKDRQGIQGPLTAHLTDDPEQQISTTTASRYWGFVKAMFRLAVSEGHLAVDPAVSLKVTIRNGESQKKRVEFSTAEVWKYFKTPIFTGYRSRSGRFAEGACFIRDAHWWSYAALSDNLRPHVYQLGFLLE